MRDTKGLAMILTVVFLIAVAAPGARAEEGNYTCSVFGVSVPGPRLTLYCPALQQQVFCKLGVAPGSVQESQMLLMAHRALANNLKVVVRMDPALSPNAVIYNMVLQ